MSKPNCPANQPLPSLSSLLWAHEMRRENIQILNEVDTTKTNLENTTSSLATLEQALTVLDETVKKLQASTEAEKSETSRHLAEIRDTVVSKVGEFVSWSEEAKELNRALLMKVEDGERKCEETVKKLVEERWETWREKAEYSLGRVVQENARGHGLNQVIAGATSQPNHNQASGEQVLVANSMSTQQTSPSIHRQLDHTPLQTLSQSTLGGSSFSDANHRQQSLSQSYRERGYTLRYFNECESGGVSFPKQNGLSISQYFAFAQNKRSQLPPRKREGWIVEAFVAGLDHLGSRIVIESALDEGGWTWDMLANIVRGMVPKRCLSSHRVLTSREAQQTRQGISKNGDQEVKPKTRPRRQIPIVPADEEDDS